MKPASIRKPVPIDTAKALQFATDSTKKPSQKTLASVSGLVPAGDVRLTANMREDLHLKLKIEAAKRRTTVGELLEELVEKHL